MENIKKIIIFGYTIRAITMLAIIMKFLLLIWGIHILEVYSLNFFLFFFINVYIWSFFSSIMIKKNLKKDSPDVYDAYTKLSNYEISKKGFVDSVKLYKFPFIVDEKDTDDMKRFKKYLRHNLISQCIGVIEAFIII